MISSCDAVIEKYNSSIRKFGDHNYQKWEKVAFLLVDYLKEKAKDSVFKLSKTAAKEKQLSSWKKFPSLTLGNGLDNTL